MLFIVLLLLLLLLLVIMGLLLLLLREIKVEVSLRLLLRCRRLIASKEVILRGLILEVHDGLCKGVILVHLQRLIGGGEEAR
jgi:hypothetical protein